jgi:predicted ATP-binding protein involved in virulence
LSEGEKQLLTIIGLLTIQKDSDCVFLLDEPDAFLYPQWQRELTEQINNIEVDGQILLSTHSPLSLGEVPRENILLFENGYAINPPINTYGTTSEAVLEVVMGVEERNSRFNVLIDEFDVFAAKRNIRKCKEIVIELKSIGLPEDDVFFLEAEAEIIRLEVLLEENN